MKLRASLVFGLSVKQGPPTTTGQPLNPIYFENISPRIMGSSDENPILLAGVGVREFRNYLLVIVGLPSEKEYEAILNGASDPRSHSPTLCTSYLDIMLLANKLGRPKLYEWAWGMLYRLFTLKSMHQLASHTWDKDTLLRLRSFMRGDMFMETLALNFIHYFIGISVSETTTEDTPAPPNYRTCVQIYKDPALPKNDHPLFGCIFLSVLCQGHHSAMWTKYLTGKDKTILYVAQAQLTRVSEEFHSLHWLLQPVSGSTLPAFSSICAQCQRKFVALWDASFGRCGKLNSLTPLEDISSLIYLLQYRQSLANKWNEYKTVPSSAPKHPITWFTKKSSVSICCDNECSLHEVLANIDEHIQQVYAEFARQYHRFTIEVKEM
ncbi:hypothetical protein CTheo_4942 [Ceratobasidium theobromae]|uniref:Uncharacterized protein n=1 Tax=Ceratobasidium theobromae TaxID=1582974 RepID=A0A5N5QIY0_9AGAM|nr:hypothetical protein CTheo_4942 [Ceratobasidium theobromae]